MNGNDEAANFFGSIDFIPSHAMKKNCLIWILATMFDIFNENRNNYDTKIDFENITVLTVSATILMITPSE